jgi:ATP-dependent helicase/DNAse subunit B
MEKFKQDLIETIKEEYSNFETLNSNTKEELKNILNKPSSQKQFQIVIDFDSLIQFYKNFSFKRDIIDRFKNVNIKKSSLIVITVLIYQFYSFSSTYHLIVML